MVVDIYSYSFRVFFCVVRMRVSVCACVCVWSRCVCVCVCVRTRSVRESPMPLEALELSGAGDSSAATSSSGHSSMSSQLNCNNTCTLTFISAFLSIFFNISGCRNKISVRDRFAEATERSLTCTQCIQQHERACTWFCTRSTKDRSPVGARTCTSAQRAHQHGHAPPPTRDQPPPSSPSCPHTPHFNKHIDTGSHSVTCRDFFTKNLLLQKTVPLNYYYSLRKSGELISPITEF